MMVSQSPAYSPAQELTPQERALLKKLEQDESLKTPPPRSRASSVPRSSPAKKIDPISPVRARSPTIQERKAQLAAISNKAAELDKSVKKAQEKQKHLSGEFNHLKEKM